MKNLGDYTYAWQVLVLCSSTSLDVGRKMSEAIFEVEDQVRRIKRIVKLKRGKWNHENLFLISGVA